MATRAGTHCEQTRISPESQVPVVRGCFTFGPQLQLKGPILLPLFRVAVNMEEMAPLPDLKMVDTFIY